MRMNRRGSSFANLVVVLASVVCLATLVFASGLRAQGAAEGGDAGASGANVATEVQRIMERVKKSDADSRDRMWLYSIELRELAGEQDENLGSLTSLLMPYLEGTDLKQQLVAGQLVLSLGSGDAVTAQEVLAEIVASADDQDLMASAAQVLARFIPEDPTEAADIIAERLEYADELSAASKVTLSEAYVELAEADTELSIERLRSLSASEDPDTRSIASLALARLGMVEEVAGRLEALSVESGHRALNASYLLKSHRLRGELISVKTTGETTKKKTPVIQTIEAVVRQSAFEEFEHGFERHPVTSSNLLINAARGMVSSVDRYSEFMTQQEFMKRIEDSSGRFVGIGARVNKGRNDPAVRVVQPIYSGPAYKAGIRSGDLLWAVSIDGGTTIQLQGMEVEEVVKFLRGPSGSAIKLWVKRRGESDPVELNITRSEVRSDTSTAEMLPGDIGYLYLSQFGRRSEFDVAQDLITLKKAGMKGLIFDLRGNPGGRYDTVLNIANMFLPRGTPISRLKGKHEDYSDEGVDRAARDPAFPDLPLVVLIDGSSASGSELLSGTWKAHGRATVIGEESFGKGIGQGYASISRRLKPSVPAARAAYWVKTTVFDYYIMPEEISIDSKNGIDGVKPHIPVHNTRTSTWEFYRRIQLRESFALDDWVRENWEEHRDSFMDLAAFDGYSSTNYPGFDKLYESLGTQLSKDIIRRELQDAVRRRAADDPERMQRYSQNYQADLQLQRAVIEVAAGASIDPAGISFYRPFLKDHPEATGPRASEDKE